MIKSTTGAFAEIEKLYKSSKSPDPQAEYTLLESLRARGNQTPYFIYAGSREPKHIAEAFARVAQGSTNVPGELIEMVLASLKAADGGTAAFSPKL